VLPQRVKIYSTVGSLGLKCSRLKKKKSKVSPCLKLEDTRMKERIYTMEVPDR